MVILGAKKNALRSAMAREEEGRRDEKIGWPAWRRSSFRRPESKAAYISLPSKIIKKVMIKRVFLLTWMLPNAS